MKVTTNDVVRDATINALAAIREGKTAEADELLQNAIKEIDGDDSGSGKFDPEKVVAPIDTALESLCDAVHKRVSPQVWDELSPHINLMSSSITIAEQQMELFKLNNK